jgi:ribonuclease R
VSKKSKDPHFERELEKYEDPIPSREYIIQVLTEYGRPLLKSALFKLLEVRKKAQQKALIFRLRAMMRDGQIMFDRKDRICVTNKTTLLKGRVQAHAEGLGFFIPENAEPDMVLSAREMKSVMHGDVVLAYQSGIDRKGRKEGRVHEILERAIQSVAGRFVEKQGVCYVEPEHKYLFHDILIPPTQIQNAKNGQMVIVKIVEYPTTHSMAIGRVEKVLGEYLDPGLEIDVAILNYGLPSQFDSEVVSETYLVPKEVREKDLKGRRDLRHLPFVTIDGQDAKDFDDAVCCQPMSKGQHRLWVAIADVSHYVLPNSAIDHQAAIRGNSVYFPGRVVPMLPEVLSNGICSLNPQVDRLCMVAEMVISEKGQIRQPSFYRAVIHSRNRLIYDDVHQYLQQDDGSQLSMEVWEMLKNLHQVYKTLLTARLARGAIELDTVETMVLFDASRKIEKIVPVVRNEAHRIIEECMLAANVAVASFIESQGVHSLYRVHEQPDLEKMKSLQTFLGEFGIECRFNEKTQPKQFQQVLEKVRVRPEKQVLETVMLRSLKQAQYAVDNLGHFGLGYQVYTHFTSPIRRYPDLIVHRILGDIIEHQQRHDYSEEKLQQLAQTCSMTERRADEATRDVLTWLKCIYIKDKIGQVFDGTISAVTSFGLFVTIKDVFVEGLVHVTSLKNDYYAFDALRHRLVGERTGQVYHLGDAIKVLVARVDADARKIDFDLVKEDV